MAKKPEGINDANQLAKLNKLVPTNQKDVLEWIQSFYCNAVRGDVSKRAMREASKKLKSFLPKGYYTCAPIFPVNGTKDEKYKWLVKMAAKEFAIYPPGAALTALARLFEKQFQNYKNT